MPPTLARDFEAALKLIRGKLVGEVVRLLLDEDAIITHAEFLRILLLEDVLTFHSP